MSEAGVEARQDRRGRRVAPLPTMLVGAVLALLLMLLALFAVLGQPWMGVTLAAGENGYPVVQRVHPLSKAPPTLRPGQTIVAMIHPVTGDEISLYGFVPLQEPPGFPTFAEHNAYLEREGRVAEALQGEAATFMDDEGRKMRVPLQEDRPLRSVPLDFWLFNLFGMIAWTISLAVWVARPRQLPARLLCLSGAGFFIATLFNSVYLGRELALPESSFLFLSRLNNIGLALMLVSLLLLLVYYPRRLTRWPASLVLVGLLLVYQLNEIFQGFEFPLHTYYVPIMLLYLAGTVAAVRQWRLSREQPLDRAALKWLFLSIFIAMGLGLAIYFVPIALTGHTIFPQAAMVGVACTLYIGFAFGVTRYRLFDLERWWFRVWAWFLGGLAVVVFDLFLMAILGMQPVVALGIAVVAAGWLYFPLRQWAWQAMAGKASASPENSLVEMVETISSGVAAGTADRQWRRLLQRLYEPAGITLVDEYLTGPAIRENGAAMDVPLLTGRGVLRMNFADRGRRLYGPGDVEHASGLLMVSRRVMRVRLAEIEAARAERDRIMRDLHDDVGGRILTLLRNAPDEHFENLARNALQSLRETMHALDDAAICRLDDSLDDWRTECHSRCQDMGIPLQWRQAVPAGDSTLSIRHHINIRRILSEALTNAFRHATPEMVSVEITGDGEQLGIEVINNGVVTQREQGGEADVLAGRGLNHMRTRAEELGGMFSFQLFDDVARLRANVPLTRGVS